MAGHLFTPAQQVKQKWTKAPFDHQLFIENKGQFNADIKTSEKILYQVILGDVRAYFTPSGIVYRYDELPVKFEKKNERDPDNTPVKPITHYETCTWVGANTNVAVLAKEEQTNYYIYPTGTNSSINVNIFKRIVYRNIYPGIDIEYSFITGKPGIKYSIIAHPGADISKIKLQYSGSRSIHINAAGDAVLQTNVGEITDHAPVTYYQHSGKHVTSSYLIMDGNIEGFSVSNPVVNTEDDLIIDPWTTDPKFTNGISPNSTGIVNKAYDVDYDDAGNVYAYGSYWPCQLTKFNSAGVQQWTFNATTISWTFYGDFAVDKVTGTSYVVEGANNSPGSMVLKVNTLGALKGTFPGNSSMHEMWRAVYNSCTHQIVIGGGGTNPGNTQAAVLDTNMLSLNAYNPLGSTTSDHDVALVAMDPTGNTAWMAVAQLWDDTTTTNLLMSLPVPVMATANYIVPNGLQFVEGYSINYTNPPGYLAQYPCPAIGMNGMIASLNWLYMYDGSTLYKVNKATGATVATKKINIPTYNTNPGNPGNGVHQNSIIVQSGGLDADDCDNVYVGTNKSIQVYNSSFSLLSTIPLTDTVYDVVLGKNLSTLYSCGRGFVSSLQITSPASSIQISNTVKNTTCGLCTGSVTPTLLICGAPPTSPVSYSWSPGGQTTQTVTNLCKGTYTVTMTLGCGEKFTDTVTINEGISGVMSLSKNQTNISCSGPLTGTAVVAAAGGSGLYTYSWSPAGGTSDTAKGLSAGTYTVTVKDTSCHVDTAIFTITAQKLLTVSANVMPVACYGGSTGQVISVITGGTAPFTYIWSNGNTLQNATGLSAGSYTVTVTDVNGCTGTVDTTVTQPVALALSAGIFPAKCSSACNGSGTVIPSGGTTPYSYLWGNGATTISVNNLCAGIDSIVVTDANGCKHDTVFTIMQPAAIRDSIVSTTNVFCFGDTTGKALVGVTGGSGVYSYSWSTVPIQTNAQATSLGAGIYTVTITDGNGCKGTAIDTLTQPALLVFTLPSTTICVGQSATIGANASGGTSPYSYNWNTGATTDSITVSPVANTTYTLTVTDANGCSNVQTVNVDVNPPLKLTISPNKAGCPGSSFIFTATVSGGDGSYTYTWLPGPFSGTAITVAPAGNTTYTVTVSDGCGSPPVVDSVKAIIDPVPVPNFTASDTVGCTPVCVNFIDKSTIGGGGTITGWNWNFGNGGTSTQQTPPSYCYTASGSYNITLTVTTDNGCSATLTIPNRVVVYAHPHADFSMSPQPADILNPTIYFTDKSTDPYGIKSWYWPTFGDNSDSNSIKQNPVHTYADTGSYCATLIVTNIHGCKDSVTQCLEINPYWTLYIPNAFTPQGDGINETFNAKGVGIKQYEMWVFDRWGMQLFYTNSLYKGWDGKVQKGSSHEICQEDTYVYLIEATDCFYKEHKYIGRVTIIK